MMRVIALLLLFQQYLKHTANLPACVFVCDWIDCCCFIVVAFAPRHLKLEKRWIIFINCHGDGGGGGGSVWMNNQSSERERERANALSWFIQSLDPLIQPFVIVAVVVAEPIDRDVEIIQRRKGRRRRRRRRRVPSRPVVVNRRSQLHYAIWMMQMTPTAKSSQVKEWKKKEGRGDAAHSSLFYRRLNGRRVESVSTMWCRLSSFRRGG